MVQPMRTGLLPPAPIRRRALGVLATAAVGWPSAARAEAARAAWAAFQARFVAPEGRVVDTGNGGISHSEGQGWGLLLALRAEDRPGFERLLGWTRRTLGRPRDMLHAWRFRPDAAMAVDDPNNASDGDLCIAWALLDAGRRWGVAEHAALGAAIGRDVLRLLVRRAGSYSVLLPGLEGFERPDGLVVNLSYYVFPAFMALARAVPDPAWARLAADGLMLLRQARFGRWELPPDWLLIGREAGALAPAQGWPARFSYDAVRVPLWLAWAGLWGEPALRQAGRFWTSMPPAVPAWADLLTDAVAPYPASGGVAALAQLAARTGGPGHPTPREVLSGPDYYATALGMLAAWAGEEGWAGRG